MMGTFINSRSTAFEDQAMRLVEQGFAEVAAWKSWRIPPAGIRRLPRQRGGRQRSGFRRSDIYEILALRESLRPSAARSMLRTPGRAFVEHSDPTNFRIPSTRNWPKRSS
jgi:hypothetical protein